MNERLKLQPLASFKTLFATLRPPTTPLLKGIFRAEFVGPTWLRALAPQALALSGLGGWWGKEFDGCGAGVNLVLRGGQLRRIFPLQVTVISSPIDGKSSLAVQYTLECPFPWPYIVDELRLLETGCLLGLTYANRSLLRGMVFPFLLHSQGQTGGSSF